MALVFAVMHLYNIFNSLLLLSIPFFILFFFKSVIDKSMERSTIAVCYSHMFVFNRSITNGTNSSTKKKKCLMFVHDLFDANLCPD